MLDIKFLRENPDLVKENIKKKFQDEKLVLVDEIPFLNKLECICRKKKKTWQKKLKIRLIK